MGYTYSKRRQLQIRNEEIYKLHKSEGYSYSELKERFGISRARIGQIINNLRLDKVTLDNS